MLEIQSFQERMLMDRGYHNFSTREKNELIAVLANRNELPYSAITDEFVLNHHKNLRVEMVKQECEEAILFGFTATNGHHYRTNRDDQINMIGQKDFLEAGTTEVVYWKTENQGYVGHTVAEWLDVYKQAFAHKLEKLMKYDTLKGMIMEAVLHEDIITFNWDTDLNPPVEEPPIEEPPVEEPVVEEPVTEEPPTEEPPVEEPAPTEPVEEPAPTEPTP